MKTGNWFGLASVVGAGAWLGWGGAVQSDILEMAPSLATLDHRSFDVPSLLAGIALGLSMQTLRGVAWLDLPKRVAHWLTLNERNIYRAGAAAACLAILIFY